MRLAEELGTRDYKRKRRSKHVVFLRRCRAPYTLRRDGLVASIRDYSWAIKHPIRNSTLLIATASLIKAKVCRLKTCSFDFKADAPTTWTSSEKIQLTATALQKEGIHPEFGLCDCLATPLCLGCARLKPSESQVSRVLAHQWKTSVGPWQAYMTYFGVSGSLCIP